MIKVTDLEKFVLEQIYRPYQTMLGIGDKRLERLTTVYNLDTVIDLFAKNTKWRDLVMDRIISCGFVFPEYIQHPLVDFIKNYD